NFWVDPATGVNYLVAVQTPIARVSTVSALLSTPVSPGSGTTLLRNGDSGTPATAGGTFISPRVPVPSPLLPPSPLATHAGALSLLHHTVTGAPINPYGAQPIIDVRCGVGGRALGGVPGDVQRIMEETSPPRAPRLTLRGQSESMLTSFKSLGLGL